MGSSGSSSSTGPVRYAPYIEDKHKAFLAVSEAAGIAARLTNPYENYVDLDFDDAFFGSGYVMASYPSLYDMFGKFMAGLDIDSLWDQVLSSVQDNDSVRAVTVAHRTNLDEDLTQNVLPRIKVGIEI